MKWQCCAIVLGLLGGCANQEAAVMPESWRSALQQQPTAVLFTDDVGEIRYTWGRTNTPEANRRDHAVRYQDQWDAGPDITAVHADQLAQLGLQARSVYALLTAREVADYTSTGREERARHYLNPPILTPELREALLGKGERYLCRSGASGNESIPSGIRPRAGQCPLAAGSLAKAVASSMAGSAAPSGLVSGVLGPTARLHEKRGIPWS